METNISLTERVRELELIGSKGFDSELVQAHSEESELVEPDEPVTGEQITQQASRIARSYDSAPKPTYK